MSDVNRLVMSIGKKIFIDYYDEFKNPDMDKKILAEKLLQENPKAKSITGQVTRVNCARRIFDNNLQIKALENIINSDRINEDTINKAKIILEEEKSRL